MFLLVSVAVHANPWEDPAKWEEYYSCKETAEIFSGVECKSPLEQCYEAQQIFSGVECPKLPRLACATYDVETQVLSVNDVLVVGGPAKSTLLELKDIDLFSPDGDFVFILYRVEGALVQ